jgi:serine/threonine protein kinase
LARVPLPFGSYRVVRALSQGPGAEVFEVHDGTTTAIGKRLVSRLRSEMGARTQLATEIRVLELLGGIGAPKLLASGTDGEGPWLVMEALPHVSLAASRFGAELCVSIATGALASLALIHEASDEEGPLEIVHGDVSPDNLLLSPPDARFIDFGLATFRDAPVLPAGAFRGTPRFVAPEVARGDIASQASDLFSVGLTLLFAASGEPPRTADTFPALLMEAGETSVLPYAERVSAPLPSVLQDVLIALVAEDPSHRPRSAREALAYGSW